MADLATSPWWVVVAGAVPSIASGAWVIWQFQAGRADKRMDKALSREELLMRDIEVQRTAASAEAKALFDRAKAELERRDIEDARKQSRIDSLERQTEVLRTAVDKWADLARAWKARCHAFRHELRSARSTIAMHLAAENKAEHPWPDDALPDLEDIKP